MERVGLVARVEEQLERAISLGMLPECGQLGSEEKLARSYGVSRGTVREALRRLAARGLVEQHPGRKTRAVALDEALTLENLGVALHDERSPGSRRLLEGYFSLKRQVTVELLADCCTQASTAALEVLTDVCFELWDAARWQPGERRVQLEFELLKLAARATDRPGHLLLIQSLQRAFQGIAARVLPLVDCEALRQWACCAMDTLRERDSEALKRKLPPLLRACDERVLGRLTPAAERDEALEAQHTEEDALPVEADSERLARRAALGLNPSEPGGESAGGDLPGAAFTNLSDCRTTSCASPPEGDPQPEPPSTDLCGPARVAVGGEGGPLHCTKGHHPPPAVPEGCAPGAPPLLSPRSSPPREPLQPFASSSRTMASTPHPIREVGPAEPPASSVTPPTS
jgi:DNA-binding FadR family transcriptional regulator